MPLRSVERCPFSQPYRCRPSIRARSKGCGLSTPPRLSASVSCLVSSPFVPVASLGGCLCLRPSFRRLQQPSFTPLLSRFSPRVCFPPLLLLFSFPEISGLAANHWLDRPGCRGRLRAVRSAPVSLVR